MNDETLHHHWEIPQSEVRGSSGTVEGFFILSEKRVSFHILEILFLSLSFPHLPVVLLVARSASVMTTRQQSMIFALFTKNACGLLELHR